MNKEMLNKEKCQSNLMHEIKKSFFKMALYFIFGLTLAAISIFVTIYTSALDKESAIGVIILAIVFLLICSLPALLVIRAITAMLIRYFKIKKGKIFIVEDTFNYAEKEKLLPFSSHGIFYDIINDLIHTRPYSTGTVMRFDKHAYHVSAFDTVSYDYSTPGDKFYLLLLNPKSKKAIAAYNTKFYTLEETANF